MAAPRSAGPPWRLLLLLLCLTPPGGVVAAATVAESELVGVWKICYEPGLADVYEPSSGYLVLMPGGRYYELREDCCAAADESELRGEIGWYEVEGTRVVLRQHRDGGSRHDRTLQFRPRAAVVLFDDLRGPARELPVLAHDGGLNYGFAKVYPAPEG